MRARSSGIVLPDGGFAGVEQEGAQGIVSLPGQANGELRFRLSRVTPDNRGAKHFLIVPYSYGTAIEYNGVVECWVDEWSIHSNHQGPDAGAGASFWVGNSDDTGGLHLTAYGESDGTPPFVTSIISELFTGQPAGPMRFITRQVADYWTFMNGLGGAEVERIRFYGNGDIRSCISTAEEVWIGAAGTGGEAGISFGLSGDSRIWRIAPGVLRSNVSHQVSGHLLASVNTAGQIRLGGNSGVAAIYFGTNEDTNLYRSSPDVLKTDDKLEVNSLRVGSTATAGHVLTADASGNGTWQAASGGSGSTSIKSTEIDFGTTPIWEKDFTITDAAVSPATKVRAYIGYEAPTGKTLDELEFEHIVLLANGGSGVINLNARSLLGKVIGRFVVHYLLG